jgi:hypothetical protein
MADGLVLKDLGGTAYFSLDDSGNLTLTGLLTVVGLTTTAVVTAPVGSVSAPGYTFSGDTNTGVYRPAADQVSLTAGGVAVLTGITSGSVTVAKENVTSVQTLSRATIADAGTITDAQHRGGIVYQDASGGNVTMTTRTAAQLVAAIPGAAVNTAIHLYVASNHASNTSTLSGGTGVTLVGSGAVTQTGGHFLIVFTNVGSGTEAADLVRVG